MLIRQVKLLLRTKKKKKKETPKTAGGTANSTNVSRSFFFSLNDESYERFEKNF